MKHILTNTLKINSFIIVFIAILLLTSCDNLVEIDPSSDQINRQDIFEDIHTVNAALIELYTSSRQGSFFIGSNLGLGSILGMYTDELDCYVSQTSNKNITDVFDNNILATNTIVANFWATSYTNIYKINSFIEGLTNSANIDESLKNTYLGEAYFLRALYHQYLFKIYGEVPYITTTKYKENTRVNKESTNAVLSKIDNDLQLSASLLDYTYRNNLRIFPNKATVELVLAKNNLLQHNYQQAEIYALKIIQNPLYQLEYNLDMVFKKNASSTLWQFDTHAVGIATQEATYYNFKTVPPKDVALSNNLIESFEDLDKRKTSWINKITENNKSFYHSFKYKNTENNNDELSIVFRVEEAYFIIIEALFKQQKIQEAGAYLNIIRERAGLMPIESYTSTDEFKKAMLQESRHEFFCEFGHRFFDLKRNNSLDILQNSKSNWETKHELFPYPENELILNPNLSPQNYGY
ncbi:RagB/SusD family nutrient uptake outer membrane protein [Myroides injenensis]|uniref:RagB/SusD family nutrient uptake outer membrane protein n=1 Tax=Myroides injenensis TaxID=1183151 RepID=UPI0002EDDEA7|nr:RagB/SusD family nutrient uptake outer membrane protein [Myroides injenensis]